MQLLVFTTVAMMLFMVTFALDLGGSIAALVFLLVLFIGATLRAGRRWSSGFAGQRRAVGEAHFAGSEAA